MNGLSHWRSLCAIAVASLVISSAVGQHAAILAAPQAAAKKKAVTVHRHPKGFTFETPSDWRVEEREGNMLLLPPDGGLPREIYAANEDASYRDVRDPRVVSQLEEIAGSLLAQPQRRKTAEPLETGSGVVVYAFDGLDGQTGAPIRVQFFLTAASERLLLLMAMAAPDQMATREPDLRQIAASMAVSTQGVGAASPPAERPAGGGDPQRLTDNSAVARAWAQRLSGKLLTHMTSYSSGSSGGYSGRTTILLAADGTFTGQSSSSVSIDVSGAAGNSGGVRRTAGRWHIYRSEDGSVVLRLLYEGQAEYEHNLLEDRGGQTFINSTRWFVTDPK